MQTLTRRYLLFTYFTAVDFYSLSQLTVAVAVAGSATRNRDGGWQGVVVFGYKLMTERTPDWAMGIGFRGLFLTWCLLCVRSTNVLVPYGYKFLFMRVWLPARARRVTWGGLSVLGFSPVFLFLPYIETHRVLCVSS